MHPFGAFRSDTSLVVNMTRSSTQKKRGQWKWMDRAAIEDKHKCAQTAADLIARKTVWGQVCLERCGSAFSQGSFLHKDTLCKQLHVQ